jgi:hypothetical protein
MHFTPTTISSLLLLISGSLMPGVRADKPYWGLAFYSASTCSGPEPAAFGDTTDAGWGCTSLGRSVTPSAKANGNIGRCGGFNIALYTGDGCHGDMTVVGPNCAFWEPKIGGGYEKTWKSFEVKAIHC